MDVEKFLRLQPSRLEAKSVSCNAHNCVLDVGASQFGIAVWNALKCASEGLVGATSKVVVDRNGISGISGVQRLITANKYVGFNKDLSTIAGVDPIVHGIEVAVVEVASAEADRWCAGVDVFPVVVVLSDAEMSGILGSVAITVSDEIGLPVVVNVGVRDSDIISSMSELKRC